MVERSPISLVFEGPRGSSPLPGEWSSLVVVVVVVVGSKTKVPSKRGPSGRLGTFHVLLLRLLAKISWTGLEFVAVGVSFRPRKACEVSVKSCVRWQARALLHN